LPNVGPYIYDVSISGFTRSSIYIYDISSLRVNGIQLTGAKIGTGQEFSLWSDCQRTTSCRPLSLLRRQCPRECSPRAGERTKNSWTTATSGYFQQLELV